MEHTVISPPETRSEAIRAATALDSLFLPNALSGLPAANLARMLAVTKALAQIDRVQLGATIEVLVALLDAQDGEPDAEDATDAEDDFALSPMAKHFATGPGCIVSDGSDISATEWHTRGRHKLDCGIHDKAGHDAHEDDEEDDAAEDDDDDTAVDDGPCDEPYQDLEPDYDVEREQLPNDVPALPVFTAEHNIFTDQRTYLGMNAAVFIGKPVL